MNFDDFLKNESDMEYGFGVHYFLTAFNETFYKSSMHHFDSYINEFSYVKKWMIFSDYALYDKNKKRDVITFTLIPYILDFKNLSTVINYLSPSDLKKTRKVNNEFINFLKNGPVFNISISLDRKRRLHKDENFYFKKRFELMKNQLYKWCETTPEGKYGYIKLIDKLNILIEVVSKPGANLKVIRDIEILSTLAAYIIFEVTKKINIDIITWFSDRDAMLSFKATRFKEPVIFDFVHHLYHLFCNTEGIDSSNKLAVAIPESNENGKVWYDALNRIPDLIAGTLSDYDSKFNLCSHVKFIPILEELFTNERRNVFFNIDFSLDNNSASRLTWAKIED